MCHGVQQRREVPGTAGATQDLLAEQTELLTPVLFPRDFRQPIHSNKPACLLFNHTTGLEVLKLEVPKICRQYSFFIIYLFI